MLKERIKLLCKEKGVSLSQVERDCGFARGYLSKVNETTPSGKKMHILADYFGISLDALMSKDPTPSYYLNPETAKLAQQLSDNPDLRTLFDAAKDSTPEDLRMAAELLTRLKGTNADA